MARLFILIICVFLAPSLEGCTDFLIQNKQNEFFNGRSMEFAQNLDSQLVLQASGESVQSSAPANQPGLSWVSKYSYLGITAINKETIADGLNEKGLSFGALLLPNASYQNVSLNQQSQALAFNLIGKWILGNFATVDELKKALPQVRVWKAKAGVMNSIPNLHFSVHDASGKSIVVEYINGNLNIYDNPYRVLTNYPTFPWHVTNLENYVSLKAMNAQPLKYMGKSIDLNAQGTGLMGIPGDFTPPSRLVRIFYLKYFARPPLTTQEGVNLAFHLLNTVDIPKGTVRASSAPNSEDFSRWIVVKDLTHQVLYFRTYDNLNVYRVSLNELPIRRGAKYVSVPTQKGNPYTSLNDLFNP